MQHLPVVQSLPKMQRSRCITHDLDASLISLLAVTALGDLLDRLDPDRHRRGKEFERICTWFLTQDPRYTHLHQVAAG